MVSSLSVAISITKSILLFRVLPTCRSLSSFVAPAAKSTGAIKGSSFSGGSGSISSARTQPINTMFVTKVNGNFSPTIKSLFIHNQRHSFRSSSGSTSSKTRLFSSCGDFNATQTVVNNNMSTQVIPRAAVSVVVLHSQGVENENKYVLVQRGKEPNKGMWSLPGGKIETGEASLDAAKRELWEETGLGIFTDTTSSNGNPIQNSNEMNFDFHWCEDGPVCITDSIHREESENEGNVKAKNEIQGEGVKFHYVISQWFVEVKSNESGTVDLPMPPTLVASDDAADAGWWDLESIEAGIQRGEVTSGVEKVIQRAELMYSKGLLS